jgi:uncharacterized protein YjiK
MLFQRECLLLRLVVFVYSIPLLTSCIHKSYSSPEGYDMEHPKKMEIGKVLTEISGIVYNDDQPGSFLAISDSRRQVFELNSQKIKLKDYTDKVVPPDSDLEDITKVNDTLYLLSSRGLIYQVTTGHDSNSIASYQINLPGQNDFETIYYDPSVKGLIMICKTCAFEKGKHERSAFKFDLETRKFDTTALFTISSEDVKKIVKDDDAKFDPSAAAIHPINKRLYMLSSAGNLLVVVDTRGKVIEAYHLNPDEFPQAEGIAFAPNGDMYIANEGKYGKPTLLIFPFKQSQKKK